MVGATTFKNSYHTITATCLSFILFFIISKLNFEKTFWSKILSSILITTNQYGCKHNTYFPKKNSDRRITKKIPTADEIQMAEAIFSCGASRIFQKAHRIIIILLAGVVFEKLGMPGMAEEEDAAGI